MADKYSKGKRSEIMSLVKSLRTGPEEEVAALLRQLGVRYRRNVKSLAGTPDFVVRSAETVIFVQGCFWHGHVNCSKARIPKSNVRFWKEKVLKNKSRDWCVARQLRLEGWRVINIWQCRLKHPDRVIKRLERLLKNP